MDKDKLPSNKDQVSLSLDLSFPSFSPSLNFAGQEIQVTMSQIRISQI